MKTTFRKFLGGIYDIAQRKKDIGNHETASNAFCLNLLETWLSLFIICSSFNETDENLKALHKQYMSFNGTPNCLLVLCASETFGKIFLKDKHD